MKALTSMLVLQMAMAANSLGAERLFVDTDAVPSEASWVGQQVLFEMVIAMDERPQGPPRFLLPDVPGGILLEVSGRPGYGTEERDGREYTTWRYRFAFYPQRDGTHTIPPIGARVSLPMGDGTWRAFTGHTARFKLEANWPKGAEGLRALISTEKFEAIETWEPDNETPRVGDAITRTITRKADDILGLGFPPLGLAKIDGVGIYPEPPEIEDQAYRGDVSGERVEKIVYTFDREGQVTIPGHVIPWFDLADQQMKSVRLPARTFGVAPNPALLSDGAIAQTSPSAGILWRAILGGAAVMTGLAIATKRYLLPVIARRRERATASESAAFKQLQRGCRNRDAAATSSALRKWLRRCGISLERLVAGADEPELAEQLTLLNQGLYADSADGSWDPNKCARALVGARKKLIHRHHFEVADRRSLNPLNPPHLS